MRIEKFYSLKKYNVQVRGAGPLTYECKPPTSRCRLDGGVMQKNQYVHEVVRDLYTLIERLGPGEELSISIIRHEDNNVDLLDWISSNGTVRGCGEAAKRIADAYYGRLA